MSHTAELLESRVSVLMRSPLCHNPRQGASTGDHPAQPRSRRWLRRGAGRKPLRHGRARLSGRGGGKEKAEARAQRQHPGRLREQGPSSPVGRELEPLPGQRRGGGTASPVRRLPGSHRRGAPQPAERSAPAGPRPGPPAAGGARAGEAAVPNRAACRGPGYRPSPPRTAGPR